jgi:hypothetical protein
MLSASERERLAEPSNPALYKISRRYVATSSRRCSFPWRRYTLARAPRWYVRNSLRSVLRPRSSAHVAAALCRSTPHRRRTLFGSGPQDLSRGFVAPAIVTHQVQALGTPDVLRAGQEPYAILQEGLPFFDLHDAPSPSFDLRRVADVHDDRSGTRGRPAICETSRFPSMLSHLSRCLVAS